MCVLYKEKRNVNSAELKHVIFITAVLYIYLLALCWRSKNHANVKIWWIHLSKISKILNNPIIFGSAVSDLKEDNKANKPRKM